jgi:hypothetical protein
MAKMRVEWECEIHPYIKVRNVPNVHNIYHQIKDVLTIRCYINPKRINEEVYEHEKTGNVEKIYSKLEAFKPLDKFTQLVIEIHQHITLRRVDKKDVKYVGDLDIEIIGYVRTEYPQETAIQKSILWNAFRVFYEKALYGDLKENMMNLCRKKVITLRNEIKAYLKLLPKTV